MSKNAKYFNKLGISPTTDLNEIKKAYRKKALYYHPDKNPSADAATRFIEICEAYEILAGIQNNPDPNVRPRSAEEIKAEKIDRARARYKKMHENELEKDAEYYNKITSGWRWKTFRWCAYYCLAFGIILSLDYFFTGKQKSVSQVTVYSFLPKTLQLEGELFQILEQNYWTDEFPPVRLNYSFFFKDLKSVSVIDEPIDIWQNKWPSDRTKQMQLFDNYKSREFYSYASVYYVFPIIHIFLLLPFLMSKYKRPNFNFAIGRLFSIWVIFPFVLYLSFSNLRIFQLFDFF